MDRFYCDVAFLRVEGPGMAFFAAFVAGVVEEERTADADDAVEFGFGFLDAEGIVGIPGQGGVAGAVHVGDLADGGELEETRSAGDAGDEGSEKKFQLFHIRASFSLAIIWEKQEY